MTHMAQTSTEVLLDHGIAITQLLQLMDNFTALVKEENAQLARGLPSSPQSIVARKNEMADMLEVWARAATSRKFNLALVNGHLQARFVSQLSLFQAAMNENVCRIEAAIEASSKRIDAVMMAVREQMKPVRPYGPDGQLHHHRSECSVGRGARI